MLAEASRLQAEVRSLLPALVAARRAYFRERSDASREELEAIEARAGLLEDQLNGVIQRLQDYSGLSDELLEQFAKTRRARRYDNRHARHDLTEDKVATSRLVEDSLPNALDQILCRIDTEFLNTDTGAQHRLAEMWTDDPLSLVKGVRPNSEIPCIHRFLQAIRVCQDFLDENPYYDHFAGALLVPQMSALGDGLPALARVSGETESRIRALWRGASIQTDSTAFELLVGAACSAFGRRVEFLTPDRDKSPDLRCHDPFPMVIECKRKRVLSDYEIAEECSMRGLFNKLDHVARSKGIWGTFELHLKVEHQSVPQDEVVACLIRQRLAAHPQQPLAYAWGSVAYRELPRGFGVQPSRVYAPTMLNEAFGWTPDLPTWDGIICRVATKSDQLVDYIAEPTGLLWCNNSERAVRRRAWSPLDLFFDAMNQIPPGEFAVVYVAYQEGARAEIADRRVETFTNKMKEWEHSANIRVPVAFLDRLYPRSLKNGRPDLIESAIVMFTDEAGPELAEAFPGIVFGVRDAPK